jgi:hypothetical protein
VPSSQKKIQPILQARKIAQFTTYAQTINSSFVPANFNSQSSPLGFKMLITNGLPESIFRFCSFLFFI